LGHAPTQGPSRVELFLAHLDALSGGVEPEFHRVVSTKGGLPSVTAISYRDLPDAGTTTTLTYGLSLIVGCYPVHDSERRYVREHGLEAFWRGVEWDPFDVRRPPAV
jgi:hypothetical protein